MCILADDKTRVIVQGITGRVGSTQTRSMLEYGSRIVAGVTPGKGSMVVHGVPVYDTVREAAAEHPADASIIFVPPPFAKEATVEAVDANMKLVTVITEHVPLHDAMFMREYGKSRGTRIIGPTTPGIISPSKTKIGIMPANIFLKGHVGIVSRSGTLLYEVAGNLSLAGIGQSTCLGIGADPVVGTDLTEVLKLLEEDENTILVVIVGEIGGTQEEKAAEFIGKEMKKPVIAYIVGRHAPPEERMGHAGAIVIGDRGTAKRKIDVLREAGARIVDRPSEVAIAAKQILHH